MKYIFPLENLDRHIRECGNTLYNYRDAPGITIDINFMLLQV